MKYSQCHRILKVIKPQQLTGLSLHVVNACTVNCFLPVHPLPLILPSPVRPKSQRQANPSGELIQVELSTQSAVVVEHSSAVWSITSVMMRHWRQCTHYALPHMGTRNDQLTTLPSALTALVLTSTSISTHLAITKKTKVTETGKPIRRVDTNRIVYTVCCWCWTLISCTKLYSQCHN